MKIKRRKEGMNDKKELDSLSPKEFGHRDL